jgi:hypothetical protein
VKLLFMMKSPGSIRNLESALRMLADRGHRVHLAFESVGDGPVDIARELCEPYPSMTFGRAPGRGHDPWARLARVVRLSVDYLRYLAPEYADAPKLRARARAAAPGGFLRLIEPSIAHSPRGVRLLRRALSAAERAIPAPEHVDTYIRAHKPDLVIVTPLVGIASRQANYVRSARKLGFPTALCAWSWDNLTNMGLIREAPDLVAVWNPAQAREAIELHGVPEANVVVTGAVAYDHWFQWSPWRDRAQFCATVGLSPERPVLLYLCSSRFVAPNEPEFVGRWLAALRRHPALNEAGVLVRPHPQNAEVWADAKLEDPRVTVWPRAGKDPVDDRARADYFDSIYHARAVVGVNTSALIESAIVGRPVFTVLDGAFRDTQEGTLHFHHLVGADGLLHTARSLHEHVEALGRQITEGDRAEGRNDRFLSAFVRPHGLDTPATPRLADALERAGSSAAANAGEGAAVRVGRLGLYPARYALNRRWARHQTQLKLKRKALRKKEKLQRQDSRAKEATGRSIEAGKPPRPSPTGERDAVESARRLVRSLAVSDRPVLAGPWLGEVGYELLYWIPFLNWAVETRPTLADRLVVVSRGGSAHWYQHLGVRYVDLFDLHDPDTLRRGAEEASTREARGQRKQMVETDFDRDLLRTVAERLDLSSPEVLPAAVMYHAYWHLLKRRALNKSNAKTVFRHRPIRRPECEALDGVLPDEYVAVRFYFSAILPQTPETEGLVKEVLGQLTERTHVVLLNTGVRVDDHWDHQGLDSERIVRLNRLMTPTNNLALQTAAIAKASAFVGTYGGLSYLAPFLGVQTVGLYTDGARFKPHHLAVAEQVFAGPDYGRFAVFDAGSRGDAELAEVLRSVTSRAGTGGGRGPRVGG